MPSVVRDQHPIMAMVLMGMVGRLAVNMVYRQCLKWMTDDCATCARGAIVVPIIPFSSRVLLVVQLATLQP